MHLIAHRNCTNTQERLRWKWSLREKNPLLHQGVEPVLLMPDFPSSLMPDFPVINASLPRSSNASLPSSSNARLPSASNASLPSSSNASSFSFILSQSSFDTDWHMLNVVFTALLPYSQILQSMKVNSKVVMVKHLPFKQSSKHLLNSHQNTAFTAFVPPWYDQHGWLGIKKNRLLIQFTPADVKEF